MGVLPKLATMKVFLILTTVLSLTSARAVRDDNLDAYLRQILELLKAQMPGGIPDLGIPPLDPLQIPHFDISPIEEDIVKVTIEIDNLVISNLATFETKIAHLDIEQLSLADLRGDADYKLDGTIASIFPLCGEGPMMLEIFGLDLYAKAGLLINTEGFIEVTEMDITA